MSKPIGKSGACRREASLAAAAVVCLIFGTSEGRADSTDDLLDQLKAKGVLTKTEYAKLKQRHAAEVAGEAAPGPGPAGPHGNDRYVTALDKGIGVHIPGATTVTKDNGVVTVGDVDVKLTGELIFFGAEGFKTNYTGTAGLVAAPGGPVLGVAGGLFSGASQFNNSNAIRSGLLPSAVLLSLNTNQLGWDLGFTVGAYFGGNNIDPGALNANGPGSPVALGTPGIDLRRVLRHHWHARIWHSQNRPRSRPVRRRRDPQRLHAARLRLAWHERDASQHGSRTHRHWLCLRRLDSADHLYDS